MEHADHSGPVFPVQTGLNVSLCVWVCACLCLFAQAWMSALSLRLRRSLCSQSRGKVRVSAQHVDEKASSLLSLGLDVEHSGLRHGTEKRKKKVDYCWFRSQGKNQVSIGTKCLFCIKIAEKTGRIVISFLFYCWCVNYVYICTF